MCFDILWLKAPSSTLRTSFILQKNRTMKANPAAQSGYAATRWQRRPNHGPLVPREVPLRVGPAAHTAEGRAPARFPKCPGSPAAPGPLGQQVGRARGRGRRRHARATGTFLRTGSGLVSHTHTHTSGHARLRGGGGLAADLSPTPRGLPVREGHQPSLLATRGGAGCLRSTAMWAQGDHGTSRLHSSLLRPPLEGMGGHVVRLSQSRGRAGHSG